MYLTVVPLCLYVCHMQIKNTAILILKLFLGLSVIRDVRARYKIALQATSLLILDKLTLS